MLYVCKEAKVNKVEIERRTVSQIFFVGAIGEIISSVLSNGHPVNHIKAWYH